MGYRIIMKMLSYGAEEASLTLSEQEEGRKDSHQKIVGDIEKVKQNIDQVWQRVGKCS